MSFRSEFLKTEAKITVIVSFNATVRQMTEMFQRKNDRNVSAKKNILGIERAASFSFLKTFLPARSNNNPCVTFVVTSRSYRGNGKRPFNLFSCLRNRRDDAFWSCRRFSLSSRDHLVRPRRRRKICWTRSSTCTMRRPMERTRCCWKRSWLSWNWRWAESHLLDRCEQAFCKTLHQARVAVRVLFVAMCMLRKSSPGALYPLTKSLRFSCATASSRARACRSFSAYWV